MALRLIRSLPFYLSVPSWDLPFLKFGKFRSHRWGRRLSQFSTSLPWNCWSEGPLWTNFIASFRTWKQRRSGIGKSLLPWSLWGVELVETTLNSHEIIAVTLSYSARVEGYAEYFQFVKSSTNPTLVGPPPSLPPNCRGQTLTIERIDMNWPNRPNWDELRIQNLRICSFRICSFRGFQVLDRLLEQFWEFDQNATLGFFETMRGWSRDREEVCHLLLYFAQRTVQTGDKSLRHFFARDVLHWLEHGDEYSQYLASVCLKRCEMGVGRFNGACLKALKHLTDEANEHYVWFAAMGGIETLERFESKKKQKFGKTGRKRFCYSGGRRGWLTFPQKLHRNEALSCDKMDSMDQISGQGKKGKTWKTWNLNIWHFAFARVNTLGQQKSERQDVVYPQVDICNLQAKFGSRGATEKCSAAVN